MRDPYGTILADGIRSNAIGGMVGMTLVGPTAIDPLPPRPTVVLSAPGAVARQEQARRSSSQTPLLGRRQPLEYGTTSDTALPRHGLPDYFEDSPTPGWNIVIGDLPGGTTRENVWHTKFLFKEACYSLSCSVLVDTHVHT